MKRTTTHLCLLASLAFAQDASVKPGINDKFLDPKLNVEEWTKKFETESREIFHQREKIVAVAGLKPGMVMADIGAGTGIFTLHFAQAVGENGKVYAVEIAKNFLEHIKARASKASAANVQTILCTERSVELPETSIDLAFICDVYHHFEFPSASLATLHKALKPGGEMLIIDFAPHELEFLRTHHAHRRLGLSEQQMAGWARAAGLTVAGLKTFPPTSPEGLTVCLWRLASDTTGASK